MTQNRIIAKNTIMLYFRMILTMLVSLYTSRILLNTLGIEDYGIYNLIGSIVILFSFISNALTQATQRSLTFELGRGDQIQFQRVFSMSFYIYIIISFILFVLFETIGLWFLNNKLVISAERMYATQWIYQLSILIFIFSLLRIPYNSAIISYEKMSFYAYVGILESVLKLLIVFVLMRADVDKLILYGVLLLIVTLFINIIFFIYYNLKFSYSSLIRYWDKKLFIELISFSGWSMFGSSAIVATNQGVNIFLNMFNGIMTNAAMGISNQVSNAINQFISNFQVAFNPQIVKLYAANERKELRNLIFQSAKISYFLFLIISIPLLLELRTILKLWLVIVPEYTLSFSFFIIIALLIDTISGPLWMLIQANGNIRKYQIAVSSLFFLYSIIAYFILSAGYSPNIAIGVRIILSIVLLSTRLLLLKYLLSFSSGTFLKKVLLPIVLVTLVSVPPSVMMYYIFEKEVFRIVIVILSSITFTLFSIYLFGINANEKKIIRRVFLEIKKKP